MTLPLKLILPTLLIVLVGCSSNSESFEIQEDEQAEEELVYDEALLKLHEIKLDAINEDSPLEDQIAFGMVDVVADGINYTSLNNVILDKKITRPDDAYRQLIKLKPELKTRIRCWGKYKDHFVFAVDLTENQEQCSFLSIYYIREGASEFWHFYPNT